MPINRLPQDIIDRKKEQASEAALILRGHRASWNKKDLSRSERIYLLEKKHDAARASKLWKVSKIGPTEYGVFGQGKSLIVNYEKGSPPVCGCGEDVDTLGIKVQCPHITALARAIEKNRFVMIGNSCPADILVIAGDLLQRFKTLDDLVENFDQIECESDTFLPYVNFSTTVKKAYGLVRKGEKTILRMAKKRIERKKQKNEYGDLFVKLGRRDGFRCAKCGDCGKDLAIDHINPVHLGGKTELENLQILCTPCNSSKGATKVDYRQNGKTALTLAPAREVRR